MSSPTASAFRPWIGFSTDEMKRNPISVLWTKYASNPILGGEQLGTCFDVNVVRDGPAPWTMYFSWRPRKAIALV